MNFIPLTEKDIPIVQQLAHKIWNENYQEMISQAQIDYMLELIFNEERMLKSLAQNQSWFLLQEDKSYFGYLNFFPKENTMFLSKIYIDAAFQGKGYAHESMDFVVEKAKELQLSSVELTVNKHNHKALKFYQKYGFAIQKEAVFDIGNGYVMDDYVMELIVEN